MIAHLPLRLPGLVIRRARADWMVLVTAWLLLTCATTLLTAGILYGNTVADAGLRGALKSLPPSSRTVTVESAMRAEQVDRADAVVSASLARALAAGSSRVSLVVRSEAYAPIDTPATDPSKLTFLASYADLERHADLISGRWAQAGRNPAEATLSEGAAAEIGVGTNATLSLVNRVDGSRRAAVAVVGIWRPTVGDPYWLGDALEREGTQTVGGFTKRGPLMLTRPDLLAVLANRQTITEWRGVPDIDRLRVDDIDPLERGIAGLSTDIQAQLPGPPSFTVASDLPSALSAVGRGLLVSRSGVLLLTLEFAVLAGYAVILVGSLFVDRRRAEGALLQTRGASHRHMASIALGEALLLVVPAVVAAPFLALGVVALLGGVGPLADSGMLKGASIDDRAIGVSLLAGVACIAMLVVPTIVAAVSPAGARATIGRPIARTLAQRLGIDLVLLVIAALGLWQLRLYGGTLTESVGGTLGVDPMLISAPAIGLLAGAVAATRFLPRLAELAERLVHRRSGLTAPLGARQVARRPLRYTRSALLLLLAAALGTFATIYEATWTQANADEASYQAPSDERVVASDSPQLPSWAVGPALRVTQGVTAAIPVAHVSFTAGRAVTDGDVLAFDPTALSPVATLPAELSRAGIPELLARLPAARPPAAGLEVPGSPARLAVMITAALHSMLQDSLKPDSGSIGVKVTLQNPDGIHRVAAGNATLAGGDQLLEIPLNEVVNGTSVTIQPPVRVYSVDVTPAAPVNDAVAGTIDLKGISASANASGTNWVALPFDAGNGWTWTTTAPGPTNVYSPPAGVPGQILIPEAAPLFGGNSDAPPVYRLRSLPPVPVEFPAIAGDVFLTDTGTRIGDAVLIRAGAQTINLRIIGSTRIFPPLDPTRAFVIFDGPTLAITSFTQVAGVTPPREWWLSTAGSLSLSDTLRAPPFVASSVTSRADLMRSLSSDPVLIGLVGALVLGALAALVIAALGFLMSTTASAAERIGEFALLRALGLPRRSLSNWLMLENLLLLGFGSLLGLGLGVLLAWLVLPFATLTQTGARPASPPTIVVPWVVLVPIALACVTALMLSARALARPVPAGRLTAVLRTRDS